MSKIAVVTDSNSGITPEKAAELGVYVLPMPCIIDGDTYFEDVTLTQDQFYEFLEQGADVSTSQPSPADVMALWDKVLEEYDQIIHIPMSSGLSSSCATAAMLASEEEYEGKVFVVDNQRISITQKSSVYDARRLIRAGKSASEIHDILMDEKLEASIYIMVDTLKYLKKGGRVTPAAAMLGTILKIKPVLQIQGEKLDAYAKVRGQKQAKKTIIEAFRHDLENRFADLRKEGRIQMAIAHTRNDEDALRFRSELENAFPDMRVRFIDPLSLSVSCHIGPGSIAAALFIKSKP